MRVTVWSGWVNTAARLVAATGQARRRCPHIIIIASRVRSNELYRRASSSAESLIGLGR